MIINKGRRPTKYKFITFIERMKYIVVKPDTVVGVQHYNDTQIARWDVDDTLSETERAYILRRMSVAGS